MWVIIIFCAALLIWRAWSRIRWSAIPSSQTTGFFSGYFSGYLTWNFSDETKVCSPRKTVVAHGGGNSRRARCIFGISTIMWKFTTVWIYAYIQTVVNFHIIVEIPNIHRARLELPPPCATTVFLGEHTFVSSLKFQVKYPEKYPEKKPVVWELGMALQRIRLHALHIRSAAQKIIITHTPPVA